MPNIYSINYEIEKNLYTERSLKISNLTRILNSMNYYTGAYNLIRFLKNVKNIISYETCEIDLFANTIFQK